jgi:hypothetical protein
MVSRLHPNLQILAGPHRGHGGVPKLVKGVAYGEPLGVVHPWLEGDVDAG